MTIQVPLKQKKKRQHDFKLEGEYDFMLESDEDECEVGCPSAIPPPMAVMSFGGSAPMFKGKAKKAKCYASSRPMPRRGPKMGVSSAARVSRGSLHDSWDGLGEKEPSRHPDEHITATIVMYYTCSGGVPTADDVKSAIEDLEILYRDLDASGKLGDQEFDFMKAELTVKDTLDVKKKILTQPPLPAAPENFNVFPH